MVSSCTCKGVRHNMKLVVFSLLSLVLGSSNYRVEPYDGIYFKVRCVPVQETPQPQTQIQAQPEPNVTSQEMGQLLFSMDPLENYSKIKQGRTVAGNTPVVKNPARGPVTSTKFKPSKRKPFVITDKRKERQ